MANTSSPRADSSQAPRSRRVRPATAAEVAPGRTAHGRGAGAVRAEADQPETRRALAETSAKAARLQRDARALQDAVADLVRVYQFRDRDRICCHDISVTQCYALETLVEHGPLRVGALAERLFLDKSTTSRVVSTLVKKGYVEQQVDVSDRRAITLSATRQGRSLCARITDDLVDQQKQLLEDLDPGVRAGVVEVIRRLAKAADSRFRAGVSVEATRSCCAVPAEGDASCR